MPILQGVTLTSAALLERLRVANLQRMAILSHQPLREQVRFFLSFSSMLRLILRE